MPRPEFIERILSNNSIVDYLASQGHQPASEGTNRIRYICPFHGPETEPSFFVFTDDEFEYYHCFGCRVHGDFINLVSEIESLSVKSVLGKYGDGLTSIDKEALLSYLDQSEAKNNVDEWPLELIAYKISRKIYSFLRYTNFDSHEVALMEEAFKRIDIIINAMDHKSLRETETVISEQILPKRMNEYVKRIENEKISRHNNK